MPPAYCFPGDLAVLPETGFCMTALEGTDVGAWEGAGTDPSEWVLAGKLVGIPEIVNSSSLGFCICRPAGLPCTVYLHGHATSQISCP